jgi:hypothetical protein
MHRCLAGRDQWGPGGLAEVVLEGDARQFDNVVRQFVHVRSSDEITAAMQFCSLLDSALSAPVAASPVCLAFGLPATVLSEQRATLGPCCKPDRRPVSQLPSTATRLPSTPEAIHHPASTEPQTAVRGLSGLLSALVLLLSSSSRGAQSDVEPRRERTAHLRSRLCAGGALRQRRYRITDSTKSS